MAPAPAPTSTAGRTIARCSFVVGGLATLVTGVAAIAWVLDEYVVDRVQVTDASASGTGTAVDTVDAVTTADALNVEGTTVMITKTVTGSGTGTVTSYVTDVVLSDATVLRTAFAADQFGENIVENTSGDRAAQQGDVRGQRRLLRLPGLRPGDPQRDHLPRRRRPRGTGLLHRRPRRAVRRDRDHRGRPARRRGLEHPVVRPRTGGRRRRPLRDGPHRDRHQLRQRLHPGPAAAHRHRRHRHQPRRLRRRRRTRHRLQPGPHPAELAQIMQKLGARTAYNLDGGGSSTMPFQGEVVNRPSQGGERGVSDILFIGA